MTAVRQLRLVHTADLDNATRKAAHALLVDVFDGELTPEDWQHCLGGLHALAWEDGELVGHAALVQRRLVVGDAVLRTGYVEGVGVRADRRGRGHAAAMMGVLEEATRAAYQLGALASSDDALDFYAARGWQRWRGRSYALTPQGRRRTPAEDDCLFVWAVEGPLDLGADIACDWREGDVW